MFGKAVVFAPVLLAVIAAPAGHSTGARAEQPIFGWQEVGQFDGRSHHVVVPHDPKWLLPGGTLVLDFTADRLKGAQGLLSKDARGFGDGGHLVVWLDEGTIVVRMQDKKSDYVVQSPAKAVKKGVPTRLALTFGPAGMKLSVDGKVVGSNAFNGGLQGNQEPLVIGARDWTSSPRGADNPDAFFAGTISAVALYDRALDGPAIAALGPAGTALAQTAGPGTQPPPTPEVAVAPPTPPSEVSVELKMPPASVGTGAQQPVTVTPIITESSTITVPLERLDTGTIAGNLTVRPGEPPVQVRGAAIGLIRMTVPTEATAALLVFEDRAKKAAASEEIDEQRAALFVELVKAAFKPRKSVEELQALDWWATVMKQKRIAAAKGALAAYADWQRDPQGTTGKRASRFDVMFGNDKIPPSYEALLASGFARVSGPGMQAAERSWTRVLARLEAAEQELQKDAGGSTDVLEIVDSLVTMTSILYEGFGAWTTAAGSAYGIASERWKQVQEAEDLPGKLEGFVDFAEGTTPSLTESLYLESAAQQAYVALIEKTL